MESFETDLGPIKYIAKEKMFGVLEVRNIGLTKMNVVIMFLVTLISNGAFQFSQVYQVFIFEYQIKAPKDSYQDLGSNAGDIVAAVSMITNLTLAVVYDTKGRKIPLIIMVAL